MKANDKLKKVFIHENPFRSSYKNTRSSRLLAQGALISTPAQLAGTLGFITWARLTEKIISLAARRKDFMWGREQKPSW